MFNTRHTHKDVLMGSHNNNNSYYYNIFKDDNNINTCITDC